MEPAEQKVTQVNSIGRLRFGHRKTWIRCKVGLSTELIKYCELRD